MADSTESSSKTLSEKERSNLLTRIDELEKLLAQRKAEAQQPKMPKLKVGTDGIPVLVETVDDNSVEDASGQDTQSLNSNNDVINDIIDKVDKEISEDLDELIVLLKDSIIDEVKTRLMEELQTGKTTPEKR